MTRFAELDEHGNVINERDIPQDRLVGCPHFIMVPEHYRADNSCRCDDPTHTAMRVWGYVWSGTRWE